MDQVSSEYPNQIRKHYWLERYVIIAPKRNLRPDSFTGVNSGSHKTETASSPKIELDPSLYEITDDRGHWQVKVVGNLYPALTLTNPEAFGKHEVIIETPRHNVEFSELDLDQINRIFDAYAARITTLKQIEGIKYVQVFKNDGPGAAATIAHAHSQVIALPLIPPRLADEANGFEAYRRIRQRCPVCDVITWEKQQKQRIIAENTTFLAIAPYAASAPFGVWLIPKTHTATFNQLSDADRRGLARLLKLVCHRLDKARISFNYFLQDSPPGLDHHFILKVEPRANVWAGFELGTGLIINTVPPEYAAKWYQGKK